MDPNTLTLYGVAGVLSLSLALVMNIYARFQPGTRLIRTWAIAIIVLAAALLMAGMRPHVPIAVTLVAGNMVLLAAGPVLNAGVSAYYDDRKVSIDRLGWLIVAFTAPAFVYWGLIEPNGTYRSIVFSLAAAVINGRTARLFFLAVWRRTGGLPTMILALLFGLLIVWMLGRAAWLLVSEPPPTDLRGTNPTTWITVFVFILLISAMSICAMWMEAHRQNSKSIDSIGAGILARSIQPFGNRLLLLWSAVIVMIVVIVGVLGMAYANIYQSEKDQLIKATEIANNASVEQTLQVVNEVDTILHSVRSFYLRTRSLADTERFIQSIGFDRSRIDNIYLITSDGQIVIPHTPEAEGRSVADRDYFSYHAAVGDDRIFISAVESGRVTRKSHFRITRRIDRPDGAFDGLVLATVNPDSFARYYNQLTPGTQTLASLLGTRDHRLRARVPEPRQEQWLRPIDTPLWTFLETSATGTYEGASNIDGIRRVYIYQTVGSLPLVMVNGFNNDHLVSNVHERMRWLLLTSVLVLGFSVYLALLLTIEAKRRDDQDCFMSMLNHEFKTPMSTITMTLGSNGIPDGPRRRIARAVSAMSALIDRCLQSDQLAYGTVEVTKTRCDILSLLEDTRRACSEPERVNIEAGNTPTMRADTQLVSVILGNLIDNALKYSPPGSPVDVRMGRIVENGMGGTRIAVSNLVSTAGMPDPNQVFNKYYRAPGAHGKVGSGLGLHISAGFAARMGGWLRYLPSPKRVQFELWIPN